MLMRGLDPVQGMLHAAEVALRRVGKQPAAAVGRPGQRRRPIRVPGQPPLPPGAPSPARPGRHPAARHPPRRAQRARPRLGQRLADRVIIDPQLG